MRRKWQKEKIECVGMDMVCGMRGKDKRGRLGCGIKGKYKRGSLSARVR